MGSEHYCLRWNNHQSNLLGVFSQLLQDESLVDVTLACSEGAPIRAHKVVLSACSSYFQSLFLDHPEKHPIVILKDVRFAELQTLVEFMYKGEVNVQYCQLSALLKTAESLKVKGLAEMTNQNTLREPEREPERLRPHSQTCKRSNSCDSPVDATLSGPSTSAATSAAAAAAAAAASITSTQHAAALAASALITSNAASSISATTNATTCTIAPSATSLTSAAYSTGSTSSSSSHHQHHQASSVSSKREHPSERCSTSPPKRLHATKHEQDSPLPLDLYQRRLEQQQQHQQQEDTKENSIVNNNNTNEKHRSTTPQTSSGTIQQKHSNSSSGDGGGGDGIKKREDLERDTIRSFNSPDRLARHDVNRPTDETLSGVEGISGGVEKIEDVEDVEYGDEEMELDDDGDNNSEDVCLNMKIRSSSLAAALVSPQLTTQRGLESSGHVGIGGSGLSGIEGGADSARSTPLTSTLPLAFDTHSQRPASRSSREGSGLDRPSSRGGLSGLPSTSAGAIVGGLSPASSSAAVLGLHSDTVAGSSGLGPVQSVPLSLKKEIDCSEDDNSNSRHHLQPRSASASGVLGGELDYRTPHESLLRNFGMATRCPTPFAFPFTPLGLSLFDIDPSRILTMLHHQTWLAEEALRNRGLLTPPPTSKDFSQRFNPLSDLLSKDYHANHMHLNTADLLARSSLSSAAASAAHLGVPTDLANKQQQQQHRSITQQQQYKLQQQQPQPPFNIRYPSPAAFFHQQHQQQLQQQLHTQKLSKSTRQSTPSPQQSTTASSQSLLSGSSSTTSISSLHKNSDRSLTPCHKDDDNDGVVELTTTHHDEAAAIRDRDSGNSSAATTSSITSSMLYKDSLEQLLQRRHSGGILAGDANLKSYSQLLMNSTTPTDTSSFKEKSSSSSTSSTPPPAPGTPGQLSLSRSSLLKSPSDTSSLFSEPIEEETRCIVCNAQFPNVWLLEQHAALQHPLLGPAYAKHKETNHRARLPADKLFTCDVCGMQFRYLKSFKKHRLNHALERLHGKKGKNPFAAHLQQQLQEQEMVSSSQEPNMMMADTETVEDLRINIKKEKDEEEQNQQQQQQKYDEDQDATIDSAGMMSYQESQSTTNVIQQTKNNNEPNISSSEGIHSTNKRPHLLQTTTLGTHIETDSPYHTNHQQQQHQPPQHHPHALVHHPHLTPQLPGHLAHNMTAMAAAAAAAATTPQHQQQMTPQTAQQTAAAAAAAAANSMNSLNSLNSITSLINAERLPNEQFLGLNPQEASILNFLRVDAQERQRDKRPPASRFACPFCGKCVRSKENLKLHVRKHTGERPFVCLFCGRAFGGKSDLTRHLRIHTGERPYHCESCGKCFARADYLSKHLTTHIHNAPR
ncbi:maternal gene required for meiosis isoform 2-T13 [Cochliomyia hominivorax]